MRNVSCGFAEKIETHILWSKKNFSERLAVAEIMWKNCRTRQATYDNIIGHMRFTCCIIKATRTHTLYIYIYIYRLLAYGNSGYANVPPWYVTRTLPVLCLHILLHLVRNFVQSGTCLCISRLLP